MSDNKKLQELQNRLKQMDAERISLIHEIQNVRDELNKRQAEETIRLGRPIGKTGISTNSEKVRIFLDLFCARQEVFPKRWENTKNGKSGYAPACNNEWIRDVCKKPAIKCTDCPNQKFPPLDEATVESHLRGQMVIGTYAIQSDDRCIFLACDFDEKSWQEDVTAFRDMGTSLGIEVAVERSRSGNGAHAWIFFEEAVPAKLARSLGTLILAKCSEQNLRLSLESYDRFFPSQDFLQKGGFGNLIALPLQKNSREAGNSLFIDSHLVPYPDQGNYLNQIRRLSFSEAHLLLREYQPKPSSMKDRFEDVAWLTDNAVLEQTSSQNISEPKLVGEVIEIIFGSMLTISLQKLPSRVVAKLKNTASFANPEFYKRQRMRFSTYPLSRFIFSGEMREREILLPRGVLDEVTNILSVAGAQVIIRDERIGKRKLKAEFLGALTAPQVKAITEIKKTDTGILQAPPGAGKTVMACALIAERKVTTLILVNLQPLLEQWKARVSSFLGISEKDIGQFSGKKKKLTGKLDIAMLQSFKNMEDLSEFAQSYSQIIVDECHHIPATTFEDLMKQLPARYVLGLTATPYRKDGLEKILFQQCGPIRHEFKESAEFGLKNLLLFMRLGFGYRKVWEKDPPIMNSFSAWFLMFLVMN